MRKSCGNSVHTIRKTGGTTCARLSTDSYFTPLSWVEVRGKGTVVPLLTPGQSTKFSTAFLQSFTEASRQLSTLSTVPITITTKERKVKN